MSNISNEIIIISDDEEEMEQQDVQTSVNMPLWRGWNDHPTPAPVSLPLVPTSINMQPMPSTSSNHHAMASTSHTLQQLPTTSFIQSTVTSTSFIQSLVPLTSFIQSTVSSTSFTQLPLPSSSIIQAPMPSTSFIQAPMPSTSFNQSPVPSTSSSQTTISESPLRVLPFPFMYADPSARLRIVKWNGEVILTNDIINETDDESDDEENDYNRGIEYTPTGSPEPPSTSLENVVKKMQEKTPQTSVCPVCLEGTPNVVFINCRHLSACLVCIDGLLLNHPSYPKCPFCQKRGPFLPCILP